MLIRSKKAKNVSIYSIDILIFNSNLPIVKSDKTFAAISTKDFLLTGNIIQNYKLNNEIQMIMALNVQTYFYF